MDYEVTDETAKELLNPEGEEEVHICGECGLKARTQRGLRRHITMKHTERAVWKDQPPKIEVMTVDPANTLVFEAQCLAQIAEKFDQLRPEARRRIIDYLDTYYREEH